MKSIRILSLLAAALSSTPSSVSALSWTFDSAHATCEGDPFTNVYITATCLQDSYCKSGTTCTHKATCSLGDTPYITGRLTAINAFANSQVIVKSCLYGVCSKREANVYGRMCNWLTPISDQDCGDVGDYQFDYSLQLPDSGVPKWLFDALTMKIYVDKETNCQTTENNGYKLPYPLMGLGAVAGIAVALCRERRKQRREDQDDEEDDDESYLADEEESYVEMSSRVNSFMNPTPVTLPTVVEELPQNPERESPVQQYNPPSVSQNPASNSQAGNLPPALQEVSLETLREWYEQHGIAIV